MNTTSSALRKGYDEPAWAVWRLPAYEALFFTGAGLVMLMIGSWVPDPRLNFVGLPLDLFILLACVVVATTGTVRRSVLYVAAASLLPLLLIAIPILWSPEPTAGLDKWTTLAISGTGAFLLFNTVIERNGPQALARSLVFFLAALLAATVVYKAAFGFFDRTTLFLFNGAIVFARFMCIALIMSLFVFEGRSKTIAVAIFLLAVLWTESKGPILAVAIAIAGYSFYFSTPKQRVWGIMTVAFIVMAFVSVFIYFGFEARDIGRLGFFITLLSGDLQALTTGVNLGSGGTRVEMWMQSVLMIFEYPHGVGLGGWKEVVELGRNAPYPHNLFLELWSECGLILGTIGAFPFVMFLVSKPSVFWFMALTLLMAQLVSGDLADARLLLAFSLLACFSAHRPQVTSQQGG